MTRTPATNPRRRSFFLLATLVIGLAAGLFFRFHNIGKKVYWNDEIWTSLWVSGHSGSELEAEVPVGQAVPPSELLKFQRLTPGRGVDRSMAALAKEDPKQPALYLLLVRLWAGLVGDSPAAIRLFSAVVSILVLPAAFWFGCELFGEEMSALVLVLLVAVSPFHVLYAQEARPYSLWALWVFLSGAVLLAALARPALWRWALYAATIALGLYSHTLFSLVIVGHAVFVWFSTAGDQASGSTARRQYFLAAGAGILLFVPWCLFFITAARNLQENTAWVAGVTGYTALMSRLSLVFTLPFLDTGLIPGQVARWPSGGMLIVVGAAVFGFLALLALSIGHLMRHASHRLKLYFLAMTAPTLVVMVFPDLILGGSGITTARFLLPALVGFETAVAWFLGTMLSDQSPRRTWIARVIVLAIVVSGLVSSYRSAGADSWWNKYLNATVPEVAAVVNATPKPLILGDAVGLDLHRMIALAHRLDPRAAVLLVRDPKTLIVPEGYSDVFWYAAKPERRSDLARNGFRFEPLKAGLWRVGPPGASPLK